MAKPRARDLPEAKPKRRPSWAATRSRGPDRLRSSRSRWRRGSRWDGSSFPGSGCGVVALDGAARPRRRDRRGRYVGAREVEHPTDLALDATLRAAAPHQVARRARAKEEGRALHLEPQDLRQKVRQRRIGNLIVFAVDASASMDAEQRMDATRSAILALLKDAYVRRDRVALISFSGRTSQVVLRPTSSVDLAERHLSRIAVGGTTPLTHGLTRRST